MKVILKAFTFILFLMVPVTVQAREFEPRQQALADKMATYCQENWKKYGVLPSVCIAQAMQESELGKHCSPHNYWGICSCRVSFESDEAGMKKYCEVINNGCYKDAPFTKDWSLQIRRILAGGYCEPVGDYYSNVAWIIRNYDLTKYDKVIFEKKKPKPKPKPYTIIYKPTVPMGCIEVSNKAAGKVVSVYIHGKAKYVEGISGGNHKVIYTSDKELTGQTFNVEYIRAKG